MFSTLLARIRANPVLSRGEFWRFLAVIFASTTASTALALVLGFQVYAITHSKLSLGMLGLVEAIPALSLALIGGHVADRMDRRTIVLVTQVVSVFCAFSYAFLSSGPKPPVLYLLYSVVFLAGIARGFATPALSALEAQIVPRELLLDASGYLSATWQIAAIIGPALGGFAYDGIGPRNTYIVVAVLLLVGLIFLFTIAPKPVVVEHEEGEIPANESIWESIAIGVRYVFQTPALVGSMALDLFAVLFGGVIALFPVFAEILHVGARGAGMFTTAVSVGTLTATVVATRYPPLRRAGRNLLLTVAAFGVCILIFAFSRNVILTLVALFFTGVFDGVSMVIRRAILRLLSPNHMRGRIAAVSLIFIGSSNEIGAFESGVAAQFLGTVRSVWIGALFTLAIVGGTAYFSPSLRNLMLTNTSDKGDGETNTERTNRLRDETQTADV